LLVCLRHSHSPPDALGLKATMSNTKLALTVFVPSNTAFTNLANKLKVSTTSMSKNTGLMKQVMYYHFVTGSNGVKQTFHTSELKVGTKLDTMYISTVTRRPYQLSVAATSPKIVIKSVGTSAYIYQPNMQCGAGVAHGIDNLLVPMSLTVAASLG
jgi:uncharacterized surface protein with fasciclin (FAS1) repeats